MEPDEIPLVTGLLGLPRIIPGLLSRFEAEATMDDVLRWRIVWDSRTKLAMVYNAGGELVGWTERKRKKFRQVVFSNGERPPVAIEDRLFSRVVWLGDKVHKAVMMLEGRKRVFGNEWLKLEHRDFKSEVRFRCTPGLEIAAVIVAFEVYATGNCQSSNDRPPTLLAISLQ